MRLRRRVYNEIEDQLRRQPPAYGTTVHLEIWPLVVHLTNRCHITPETGRQYLLDWVDEHEDKAFIEGATTQVIRVNCRLMHRSLRYLVRRGGRYYTQLFWNLTWP